ncbi:MAG: hypothetical protein IKG82_10440 [Oscillospiraceae bacterium]|nr:hypothetical protein [Oscillospiraceae bacterium]
MSLLILLAESNDDMVNVTPVLMKFIGKFFVIFAVVAVIAVLTPRMAKGIDSFRAKHEKPAPPEDPRCKQVRGPYDMPEKAESGDSPAEQNAAEDEA